MRKGEDEMDNKYLQEAAELLKRYHQMDDWLTNNGSGRHNTLESTWRAAMVAALIGIGDELGNISAALHDKLCSSCQTRRPLDKP